ncbi:UNVERIFIED_CONTAM: hypothetical protein Sradi_0438100 [Sesamum radiatum]|uniref:Uncharacterized protein n=1 Tax=Sesamum radiatum TaxID=300843 RepID=A0AAW2W6T7_SESRA
MAGVPRLVDLCMAAIADELLGDGILEHIGCKSHLIKLTPDYLKFSNHCQQFGVYARQLRLPNALCVAETCDLLQNSKLGSLELQWIKSNDHIRGFLSHFRWRSSSCSLGSSKSLKSLRVLNLSNNQGGIEAAKFMSSIISHSQKIVAIDARYNLMPTEALSVISSGMKASKGKLEHLDLAGNSFCDQLADAASVLAELQIHGQCALSLSLWAAPSAPYDDDP